MSRAYYLFYTAILFCVFVACSSNPSNSSDQNPPPTEAREFISAADISAFPEIELVNPAFFDRDSVETGFLDILKSSGVNTARLKLWVDPETQHASFDEVRTFSARLKTLGFKVWLTVHYSDTWADPGKQLIPRRWQDLSFPVLKDSVAAYTSRIVMTIEPEYIQIGNEINSGFMHPAGEITSRRQQFLELLEAGVDAVRQAGTDTEIIMHFAGTADSGPFFDLIDDLDYDIIGISYYPLFHGKDLAALQTVLENLSQSFDKPVVIAEVAYPFTLQWNDFTHNLVGLEEQLILPDFPATPAGQRDFLQSIRSIVADSIQNGIGICYWGAELVAWKGPEATDASSWENQALFDFNNKALPVLDVFGDNE